MIKRILFVLSFIPVLPIAFACALISIFIMPPICLIIYIIKGDKEDSLQEIMIAPFLWASELPWKLTGMYE